MPRSQSPGASSLLRSRIFKRLFLSYVLLIVVFVVIYAGWYLFSYQAAHEERIRERYQQATAAWATAMDQQLLTAQAVCASVSTSENCRNVLQTAYVEKKTIDSMQLYRLLGEMTRIKAASGSINLYAMILGFYGDSKVYIPGSVLTIEGALSPLTSYPVIQLGSASGLLGVTGTSIVLNKTYLMYADRYAGFGSGTPDKGLIIVLFEPSGLLKQTEALLPEAVGYELSDSSGVLLSVGETECIPFEAPSLVCAHVVYRAFLPQRALAAAFPLSAFWPLVLMMLLGAVFMVITYQVSKRYYQPIGSISQMIQPGPERIDGFDDILSGIRSLIGERNGYRERMITISPYAQQGMLQSILSGSASDPQLRVLINEQFLALRRPCFMLALVNLTYTAAQEAAPARYRDACELIAQVCREQSDEDFPIVSFARDLQNLYVIISGDDTPQLEELFYRLHAAITDALDDPALAVTIGVSRREDDLDRLQQACADAEHALGCMLTGGRGAVYFDAAADNAEQKRFYFPKDASKRMLRDCQENNLADLERLLDEIYQANVVQADLSVAELRSLVDELHLTVRATLREAFDLSTTHIEVTRVPEPATIDEIIAYYRRVFETVLQKPIDAETEHEAGSLEHEVYAYIDQHLYSPDLSQNAVADRFGLSTKTISVLCKNHYGTTFLQYVRDRQIQRAAELLQTTDLPLEQIAQQCGFTNLLTFRRNFKAVMNMNPSDFRK